MNKIYCLAQNNSSCYTFLFLINDESKTAYILRYDKTYRQVSHWFTITDKDNNLLTILSGRDYSMDYSRKIWNLLTENGLNHIQINLSSSKYLVHWIKENYGLSYTFAYETSALDNSNDT